MPGIYVKQFDEDLLEIQMPYHDDYLRRIRKIDGAEWDDEEQRWLIPIESAWDLDDMFYGELIYGIDEYKLLDIDPEPLPSIYKQIKHVDVEGLKLPPRKFQQFGINFLSYNLRKRGIALLGDLMGSGKTFTSIATALEMKQHGLVKKCLVIVLASTRSQWVDEINRFCDEGVQLFGEFKAKYRQKDGVRFIAETVEDQKNKSIDEFMKSDDLFMIMSYQTFQQNEPMLEKIGFDMMICDEAHNMKNRESKTNKAAKKFVKARTARSKAGFNKGIDYVLFTTGTPIMNYPDEIYGLVGIVGERVFGKWRDFRAEYCTLDSYKNVIGYKNLDKLRKKIMPFMIRRTDEELGVDLPQIIEKDVWIDPHPKQKKLDDALLKEQKELISQSNPKAARAGNEKAMVIEQRLKGIKNARIAGGCHPNAFKLATNPNIIKKYDAYYVKDLYEIPKFQECIDIVQQAVNNNHKTVIFVNSKRMTKMLEQEISKFTGVVRYVGGLSDDERRRRQKLFNNNPRCMVIICNSAGSTGINLQAGRYLINYDLPHTPAEWLQRKYRIRRLDSTHDKVFIYNLLNRGLVDEQMREQLDTKQMSFEGTFKNGAETSEFHKEMSK